MGGVIYGQAVIMPIQLDNMGIRMLFGNTLKTKEKRKSIKKSTANNSSYGINNTSRLASG